MIAQQYFTNIVQSYVLPCAKNYGKNFSFQHNNARSHLDGIVRTFFEKHNNVMEWPANSINLNLIEYFWDVLERLKQREISCNFEQLANFLQKK